MARYTLSAYGERITGLTEAEAKHAAAQMEEYAGITPLITPEPATKTVLRSLGRGLLRILQVVLGIFFLLFWLSVAVWILGMIFG